MTSPLAARAMVQQRSVLDLSGLCSPQAMEALKVSLAVPFHWAAMEAKDGPFYVHQQWRSPSGATAVGVVYIRLPIPLSGQTILSLAEREYTKKGKGGEILAEWTDRFGRDWFEGQNDRYHGRGYLLVNGRTAWVVYIGYERRRPTEALELALGERSLESVLPRGVVLAAQKMD
jgi:hypothetical protein